MYTDDLHKLSFAACGLSLIISTLYILWPKFQKGKSLKAKRAMRNSTCPPGLQNSTGTDCYISSALQALSSCAYFTQWCNQDRSRTPVVAELSSLLCNLSSPRKGITALSFNDLLRTLRSTGCHFNPGQQDVHELIMVLFDAITQPNTALNVAEFLSDRERSAPSKIVTFDRCSNKDSSANVGFPFKGSYVVTQRCLECGEVRVPRRVESFVSLCLYVPSACALPLGFSLRLDAVLRQHFLPEQLQHVHCEHCSKLAGVGVKTTQEKRLWLCHAPPTLLVHLNRNFWNEFGEPDKMHNFVQFPSLLDLSDHSHLHLLSAANTTASEHTHRNRIVYTLRAVICHAGNHDCGHYVAYRQLVNWKNGGTRWFLTSDESVRECDSREVLGAHFYCLLYERIPLVRRNTSTVDIEQPSKL